MFEMLHQQLIMISMYYEEILHNGQVIFEYLENGELESIQPLQVQQFKTIERLRSLQGEFEKTVIQLCSQYKIAEPRVRHLIPYLEEQEQTEIQHLYQQIINLDKETRVIFEQNGGFFKILLDLSENVIGWLSEYNEEHSHDSQMFIDETL